MPLPFSVVIWLAALQVKFCMLMLATKLWRCKLDNRFNYFSLPRLSSMQTRDRQLISSQPLEQNLTARTASVKRTTGETDVQVTSISMVKDTALLTLVFHFRYAASASLSWTD